jgi:hypothetical protein
MRLPPTIVVEELANGLRDIAVIDASWRVQQSFDG